MGTFAMPSLGADMDSGKLTEWLVQPGDEVHRGDIVAVVDTAKSAIEVEVFEDGRITELLIEPGTEVPVGTPLASIEATGPHPQGSAPEAAADQQADQLPVADAAQPSVEQVSRVATPPVRHLAHQLWVDLATVTGSGPEGRITRSDVRAAGAGHAASTPGPTPEPSAAAAPVPQSGAAMAAAPSQQPPGAEPRGRVSPRARRLAEQRGVDLSAIQAGSAPITGDDIAAAAPTAAAEPAASPKPSAARAVAADGADRRDRMRQATAHLMARAAREIPHYYVSQTFDAQPMTGWLAQHNARLPVRERVLPIAVLLRAVVLAAQQVPALNGHWVDDAYAPAEGIHLGVATATRGGGLVTPALRDAQSLDVDGLMAALAGLVKRARAGTLRSSEIAPGSITVSSLADGGPDALFGVIYPPQVALVGIGAIADRPVAVDGMLAVRPTCTLTLAADHRATDGRTGAAFLQTMIRALANPEEL